MLGDRSATVGRAIACIEAVTHHRDVAVSVTDPGARHFPLVYVNAAFEMLTGYRAGQSVGRNARFLLPVRTDPSMLVALRDAVAAARPFIGCLVNAHRKGDHFHSFLIVEPVEIDQHSSLLVACHFKVGEDSPVLRLQTHAQQIEAFETAEPDPKRQTAAMAASAFKMRADAILTLVRSQIDRA